MKGTLKERINKHKQLLIFFKNVQFNDYLSRTTIFYTTNLKIVIL